MKCLNPVLLCGGLVLLTACEDKKCQSPPEMLRFTLYATDGATVISAANAERVAVHYYRNGQSASVSDLRVIPPSVETLEMIGTARQTADTTRFYVSVDNKPQGIIQLKTYVDNSPCDGWTHINELRFNGRVVPYDNMKPGYTLVVAP